jgi:prephenate dehydrogenase
MKIARGVLSEDDCLLREILFNPRTGGQVARIRDELKELLDIIDRKDEAALGDYLKKIREHIK